MTPTLNQGAFLEETVRSVLGQDYPDLEYIVVDGGSSDDTPAILERYRDRLAHCLTGPDEGQADALNKGFALATGSILAWLNSDDRYEAGALWRAALAFDAFGADMVAGGCALARDSADETTSVHHPALPAGRVVPLPLPRLLDIDGSWTKGEFFYQPEVFWTRELWQAAGGKVAKDLYYSMDYELWLRMAACGARIVHVPDTLAVYRMHKAQKTDGAQPPYLPELRQVVARYRAAARPLKERTLRVLFINDVGFQYGAGMAHLRQIQSLLSLGHEVAAFCCYAGVEEHRAAFGPFAPAGWLGLREFRDLGLQHATDESAITSELIDAAGRVGPDAVIVGNLHGARWPVSLLSALKDAGFRVVAFMHDGYLVSGRCAYPADCRLYETGCDETCPTADEYPVLEPAKIPAAWRTRRQVFCGPQGVALAANSGWTLDMARRSLPDLRHAAVLYYGLDERLFRPIDRALARQAPRRARRASRHRGGSRGPR